MFVRLLTALWCLSTGVACAEEHASRLDREVQNFTLDNSYGSPVSLADFNDKSVIVLAFLGTECPLARLYGPRLNDLQEKFKDQGVVILGINSNKQDSMTELAAYGRKHDVHFPLLKDVGNRVADAVGAQRTPEVFVLDAERKVRYHGRIDDQYGVGYSRDREVRAELANAIEQLLAGKDIDVPETEVEGCYIGRVKEQQPTGEITYTSHIAAIFNERCVRCHREQEIAPFTLTSYEDVQGWEETIIEVIEDQRMPPWSADPNHGSFANDARLSKTEKELIFTWIENGIPEGNPADLPTPPTFTVGWQIDEPDQVIYMSDQEFSVPAEGTVDYQRFIVDPGWTEDKYIRAAEARPDNRAIVHHILAYVVPPGARRPDLRRVIAGYAPGGLPVVCDDGVAMKVEAGSKILFEMHYTPNGRPQTDRSYLGVTFTEKDKVEKLLEGRIAINTKFRIPPNEGNYEVDAHYLARNDEMLISLTPHMHLRGKAFKYEAKYPDGKTEVLLDVPNYDFNWQLKYILKEPKLIPKGTVIHCQAAFDNSDSNPSNPDPSKTIGWGDQSWDEMMIGFMDMIPVE